MPTPVAPTEPWKSIEAHPGYLTSYYFSPEDITTNTLNQMWALRSDAVVQTISLTKKRGPTEDRTWVSAIVRVNDPQAPTRPPTLYLNPLPGHQGPAALRSAPLPRQFRRRARAPVDASPLELPVGSSGVLVGTTQRGDLLLLSLTDPDQATRIALHTEMSVRLPIAGARGCRRRAHRDLHRQARKLAPTRTAVDRGCRSQASAGVRSVDHRQRPGRRTAAAGLASTVITIGDTDREEPDTGSVVHSDLRLDGSHRHVGLHHRCADRHVQGGAALPRLREPDRIGERAFQ